MRGLLLTLNLWDASKPKKEKKTAVGIKLVFCE